MRSHETLTSVVGSSITTVAGFAALCFMTFTLGRDLGIVMAKGVLLGVVGCVTVLPALILALDQSAAEKSEHKPLVADMMRPAKRIVKTFPAVSRDLRAARRARRDTAIGKTNKEVYYDMGQCLPRGH